MRESLSPNKAKQLLEYFHSAERVYRAERADYEKCDFLSKSLIKSLCNKSLNEVEKIIKYCNENKIDILCIEDKMYPRRLLHIYNPPCVLFIRGKLPDIDNEMAIAFVGTRKCSAYGICVADKIGREFAAAGGLVISGMALGVDAAANEAALRAGAQTVAVLGCGVDICYPPKHKRLMQKIIENGAVISEFIPGTPPDKHNFPMRNRIMSGLALGVLVAEAPARSGALITAKHAEEQGRDVFAVPGDITNPCSHGTNRLIADGAKLVMCAEDIICEYREAYGHCLNDNEEIKKNQDDGEDREFAELLEGCGDETQRSVLAAIGRTSSHIDDIVLRSGLDMKEVLPMLTMFEISGIVEQTSGKHFKIVL